MSTPPTHHRVVTRLSEADLLRLVADVAAEATDARFAYYPHPQSASAFSVAVQSAPSQVICVVLFRIEVGVQEQTMTPEIVWQAGQDSGLAIAEIPAAAEHLAERVCATVRRYDAGAHSGGDVGGSTTSPVPTIEIPEVRVQPATPAAAPPPPPPAPAAPVAPPPPPPVSAAAVTESEPVLPPQVESSTTSERVSGDTIAASAVAPAPSVSPNAPAPEVGADDIDDFDMTIVAPRRSPRVTWSLVDSAGEATPIDAVAIVGRKPSRPAAIPVAQLVTLSDPERMMSKTHALIETDEKSAWITDLVSTNGTELLQNGQGVECEPNVRTPVDAGTRVQFGGVEVQLNREES